jgi:hypothetical protein
MSAYVSIRPHTSAYVSIRLARASPTFLVIACTSACLPPHRHLVCSFSGLCCVSKGDIIGTRCLVAASQRVRPSVGESDRLMLLWRQVLCFCTRKASKVSTCVLASLAEAVAGESVMESSSCPLLASHSHQLRRPGHARLLLALLRFLSAIAPPSCCAPLLSQLLSQLLAPSHPCCRAPPQVSVLVLLFCASTASICVPVN